MKVGYARVSTRRQNLGLQTRDLEAAGCEVIISEKVSGRAAHKRGLAAAIAICGSGDELVTWKLDRLGRDLVQLVDLAKLLKSRGAHLKILTGQAASIDIDTAEGRALYGIFASIADLEHSLGEQRTTAGLATAGLRKAKAKKSQGSGPLRIRAALRRKPLRCAFNRLTSSEAVGRR